MLGLLDLQLGEELDEPLEALLVPVDPEEVNLGSGGSGILIVGELLLHLSQIEHCG